MEKFKLVSLLILFVSIVGCDSKKDNSVEEGISTEELEMHETTIETLTSGNINLLVVDTLLIVQKRIDPILEIYSTNSHKLIASFGKNGQGPGEIMDPILIKQREFENGSPIITVYDLTRRIINKINLKNLLLNQEPMLKQESIPFKGDFLQYFYYADKDFILGKTEADNRFVHFNFKNDSTLFVPYIPHQDFDLDGIRKTYVYRSAVTVNKDKGLIAAFPILIASLDFFDVDGNFLRNTYFDDPEEIAQSLIKKYEEGNSDSYFYVSDADSDLDYIYGLNINNQSSIYRGSSLSRKQKIEVFDWDGNPVRQYVLNTDMPSETFAYDSNHNRFYTYCRECEDSNILYFSDDN